jgi:predicted ester cyclase
LRAINRLDGWGDRLVRWGGLALMAAGVLGLVASALFVVAVLRAPEGSFSYAPDNFFVAAAFLQGLPTSVLLCAGLLGLYFLLDRTPRPVRRTALVGVVLFSLGVVLPLTLLLDQALVSQSSSGLSSAPQFWKALLLVFSVSSSVGIALCGGAAFWARGLGPWRFVLLAVGVLDSPLSYWLVFAIVRRSLQPPVVPYADTRWMETALQVPVLLASVGWLLIGHQLYDARKRENELIAAEHRKLSEGNRSKARRLYEEAWTMENLSALDELVAEDLLDYEHDRFGREEFKKMITDLHRTFPDLALSIEEQDAEGDTVRTRCAFSGTDRGGVLWYPPTGKYATFTGTFTDRFAEGKLVEHREGIDMTKLLEQLGLLTNRNTPE